MKPKHLIFSLLALFVSMNSFAYDYDFVRNEIYYIITSLENKTVEVARSDTYSGSITIPSSVTYMGQTYTVTGIGNDAFYGCSGLTSINLSNTVIRIGDRAFGSCSGLISVTIPNSVTNIGYAAFGDCNLSSITIPKSVTNIGSWAFSGNANLKSVTMPASVITFDGECAFGRSNNIEAVYITDLAAWLDTSFPLANNPLRSGAKLYLNNVEVNDLVIPDGTTSILTAAFEGCGSLTSVTIPNSVASINGWAFASCNKLTDVWCYAENIPSTEEDVFNNTDIGSATLHVPANSLDVYINSTEAWSDFGKIITIDNSPKIVFVDSNVKNICITKWDSNEDGELSRAEAAAVTTVGTVFKNNTSITSFNELQYFTGLTSIDNKAFNDCSALESITIPNGVTSIGQDAFRCCSSLTFVSLGYGVKEIDQNAFQGCGSLSLVTIPNSVTNIGYAAFGDCNLSSITIPESVTNIGSWAFSGNANLKSVTLPASVITFDGECAFGRSNNIEAVYITDLAAWLGTSFPLANNPLRNGAKLYLNNVEVNDLVIPDGTTSILTAAFEGCGSLTSVTIPNSVASINGWAFASCNKLTDVWCYAENIPSTEEDVFNNTDIGSATLHVPFASLASYRVNEPWSGFGTIVANDGKIIEDLSELSNNKQYLIHTRNKNRGTLGVIDNHLASNNPSAYGPWACRPIVLDRNNPLITSVSQLSSPNTEPSEGSLAAMIDDNTGTFWHSTWSGGDVEAGTHYFQVEMEKQDDIDVAFKVTRRGIDNDHITEWGVYGTNNANAAKANCTLLAVIGTPYNNWGETRVSDIFKTGGYKYLRFYINNTSTGHGYGHLAEFQLYPATFDEAHGDASPFAIIQKDGGYYLYSVLDKAFITPVNNGNESVYPLLPNDNKMNIYEKDDNHFVFDFIDTGYTINVNDEPGIAIGDYGTLTDRFDDGNLFTIEEVGYFDPTEALAKFEKHTFTVTYEVMFEGNVVATATEEVASGSALPPVPASLNSSFVTLTETGSHPTKVTNEVTVSYNATWNGPFEFTKTLASAKWYNMHIRSGYYVGKQDTEPYYPTQDVDETTLMTPAYQWAFCGDPYHVKVYNRTTDLDETLTKDGDNAVMRSGDYTWDLLPNNDGFVLRVTGTENNCINQFGGSSGPLQFWSDNNSLTDDGSTFRVEEAIGILDFVINDETTSLSITSEERGKTIGFTHAFNGEWEALCLPFAIDYDAIKADFDLAEIDGIVQNDDDNDGIADITVLSIMGFKEQMTEPNTPYLIRAKNAGERRIIFDDVTIYPTVSETLESSSTSIRYEFTGSYNTLNASDLTNRYVVQGSELVKGATSLAPCRWYMTATAKKGALKLPAKIRIMPVEDVITGVSPLLTSTDEEGLVYNLAGQRLSKPQKGVNIQRGRKIFMK